MLKNITQVFKLTTAAIDIQNFVDHHSKEDLQKLGQNAYQLFKDKYTKNIILKIL